MRAPLLLVLGAALADDELPFDTWASVYRTGSHAYATPAVRAARAYIAAIEPVPVIFTYWTGKLPDRDQTRKVRAAEKVTERFHGA